MKKAPIVWWHLNKIKSFIYKTLNGDTYITSNGDTYMTKR